MGMDPANRTPAPPLRTTSTTSSSGASSSGGGMVCDGGGLASLFNKPLPPTPGSEKHERRVKKGKQQQAISLAPPPSLLNISSPMNVHHEIHVTIDPNSGRFTVCSHFFSPFSLCYFSNIDIELEDLVIYFHLNF